MLLADAMPDGWLKRDADADADGDADGDADAAGGQTTPDWPPFAVRGLTERFSGGAIDRCAEVGRGEERHWDRLPVDGTIIERLCGCRPADCGLGGHAAGGVCGARCGPSPD